MAGHENLDLGIGVRVPIPQLEAKRCQRSWEQQRAGIYKYSEGQRSVYRFLLRQQQGSHEVRFLSRSKIGHEFRTI
ncbi:MAG: hypothetical protein A3E16_03715 [Candidatus Blackburnbacteria bacterium RIFCSPHIGHO2_12_FULL_44_25]|nr:MAG: hypothetical protein A3E16_03715 [Candidatus Blackburnbacteria bacterium RIFCSPHIGHO2_12_FULL_44_25]